MKSECLIENVIYPVSCGGPRGTQAEMSSSAACTHTHIFGATSSPAVASYVLGKTALENATEFSPDAVNTILDSFYVDDCLEAVATVEEAMSLSAELRSLKREDTVWRVG